MSFVLSVALPLLVVFTMFVVGLSVTRTEFGNLARRPRVTIAALAGQWLLPPAVAVLLVKLLALPGVLAMGVILAAAAPPAVISNYYALLARANVALAVTLTAVASLGAAVCTPLSASAAYWVAMRQSPVFDLPTAKVLQQTVIGLLLPVLVGMTVRHLASAWTTRHEQILRQLALLAVGLLVAFIVTDQIAFIRAQLALLLLTAALFTGVLLAVGWLVGRILTRAWRRKTGAAVRISRPQHGGGHAARRRRIRSSRYRGFRRCFLPGPGACARASGAALGTARGLSPLWGKLARYCSSPCPSRHFTGVVPLHRWNARTNVLVSA